MQTSEKINLLDYTSEDLKAFFLERGEKPFRATQVIKWIHQHGVDNFDDMTNVSKSLREELASFAEICIRWTCRTGPVCLGYRDIMDEAGLEEEDNAELNAATFGDEADDEDGFVWDNVALAWVAPLFELPLSCPCPDKGELLSGSPELQVYIPLYSCCECPLRVKA